MAQVVAALGDRRNWRGAGARGAAGGDDSRHGGDDGGSLLVHPLAQLTVRERVAPLNRAISKVGNAPLTGGATTVTLAAKGIGATPLPITATAVREPFALAQYQEMSDDEKLARPSFEALDAGLQFGVEALAYEYEALLDSAIAYETLLIDPTRPPEPAAAAYVMPQSVLDAVVSLGAAGQAAFRRRDRYRDVELAA